MESLSLEEENKDIRNIFRLEKEQNYTAINNIRNFFKQEKETKATEDGLLRDIKNLFEHEKEEENYMFFYISILNFQMRLGYA